MGGSCEYCGEDTAEDYYKLCRSCWRREYQGPTGAWASCKSCGDFFPPVYPFFNGVKWCNKCKNDEHIRERGTPLPGYRPSTKINGR